jgi:asparagine synthase (glutamine-hydrolysing)
MCGIFGMITPGRPVDVESCYRAVQALTHRGPDGLGVLLGKVDAGAARFHLNPEPGLLRKEAAARPDFFLGHRRLSIIDLSPEAFQPMANEDGLIWVVFNGEIYNFRDLRARLEARGHVFRTDHADSEVLVHGYEEWGADLVDHLRGMFAFAILDLAERRLFMARDRFGEKPLYYSLSAAGLMFASELKAFLELPEFDRTISREAVSAYLAHGLVPAPLSIYGNTRKLRASERVMVRLDAPDAPKADTYWKVSYRPDRSVPVRGLMEQFHEELTRSIRLRMLSDVPLGMFLSGGLDSTMIVREMSLASARPVEAFTIGFKEVSHDESSYATKAAARYGARHHVETLTPQVLLDTLPVVMKQYDEPFADSSAIPTYLVSRLALRRVTVCLSGDGGDELLAGYKRYWLANQLSRGIDWLPGPAFRLFFGPLIRLLPESMKGKGAVRFLVPSPKDRYVKVFDDDTLAGLLRFAPSRYGKHVVRELWPEGASHLVDQMCITDSRYYIPEDLMVKVDRASMAVSLESRAPLLDHKLFELVARMPLWTRFDGTRGKLPFRRMLGRELGRPFVNRRKMGFAVPLKRWFSNELRGDLRDTLLASDGITAELFSRKAVAKLVDGFGLGRRNPTWRLWKLYVLQKWHDVYGGIVG